MKYPTKIPPWVLGAALFALTLSVYIPVIRSGGYIWDDDAHVYNNPTLLSTQGLSDIWLKVSATQQYYPLVFTSFWLEHRAWGFWPAGYHFDNALLHAISALLLWRLLERLKVPGAWLAAALFAVHPMNVESVAWVTERKNVLSGCLVMLFATAYVRFALSELYDKDDSLTPRESSQVYLFSFVIFLFALLSKTVACTAPGAMLLLIWWKRGTLRTNDWLRIAPMVLVGAGMALLTGYLERGQIGAHGTDFNFSPADRVLIAGRAIWHYAVKFFWPAKLMFFYPRWHLDAHQAWQFAFPLSAIGLAVAAYTLRHRIGRGVLVALLYFGGMLVPALGFVNVYPMRFSFVADHFAYLATIGLAVLAAAAISKLMKNAEPLQYAGAGAIILFVLVRLTIAQQAMYRNQQSLWTRTIEQNDQAIVAYTNLGSLYNSIKRYELSEPLFARAALLAPDDPIAHFNLGRVYFETGKREAAIEQFVRAVELAPRYADAHEQLGELWRLEGNDEAAARSFRKAITFFPRNPQSYMLLAQLLDSQGKFDEAVQLLETSARITPYAPTHYNLAVLLGRHGQRDRAIQQLREALRLQPNFEPAQAALRQIQDSPAPAP